MIPPDVASRLRLITADQPGPPQATTPAKQLTDVLSDLVPGQRLLAEIQTLLPNGTYRAMIAQRDVTLALPFSAKTGDTLEMEVVESDGKLTLAFVANRTSGEKTSPESVSATLSQAGKLIGNLLGDVNEQGKGSKATPLNGNQPLLSDFPKDSAQLVPVLKEALTKSGMFYEAHQARWVEGKLPTEALLQEPQGRLSSTRRLQPLPQNGVINQADTAPPSDSRRAIADPSAVAATIGSDSPQKASSQPPIPPDLAPLVRQQLDALATQNYIWQGQVWPGQQMHWEIEEDRADSQGNEASPGQQWHTRLKLALPGLGGVDAVMRLRTGGLIDISLVTDSDESRQRLAGAGEGLRQQMEDAGLKLTGLAVQHGDTTD